MRWAAVNTAFRHLKTWIIVWIYFLSIYCYCFQLSLIYYHENLCEEKISIGTLSTVSKIYTTVARRCKTALQIREILLQCWRCCPFESRSIRQGNITAETTGAALGPYCPEWSLFRNPGIMLIDLPGKIKKNSSQSSQTNGIHIVFWTR